jgi:TolA-binding protein
VNLDGQIRIRMGSTAVSALSPDDTQKYKQALNLYLSGAYQDAYDTVLSLWDDPKSPKNKTYGELQRLKKRCEVALNIS